MATKMKTVSFLLLFSFHTATSIRLSQEDRIAALEKRVEFLENAFDDFEPQLASRYNLNRTCTTPEVVNGEAACKYETCRQEGICAKKLKLGSKCSVVCNPGYIGTPGKDVASCKEDGYWTVDLQCEVPLVLLSGGTVDDTNGGDSSVELLSLYPSKGCDINIADMPLTAGSHRRFHNLIYINPEKLLACNGMTSVNEATCDVWSVGNNTWKHHTYPNKAEAEIEEKCDSRSGGSYFNYRTKCGTDRKKGRYAAQAIHVGGKTLVLGGMVYDDAGHTPSSSVRSLTRAYDSSIYYGGYIDAWWDADKLGNMRSFFCSVKVKDGGILTIGGLGRSGNGNTIEKAVEFSRYGINGIEDLKTHSNFADMMSPRSGHACTGVPGEEFQVLVTGGTKAFNEAAASDGEIFSWKENSWKSAASMQQARFGHALVTVGEKIFAIGGDDRNPNNVLDTIEEFDVNQNTWQTIQTKLKKPRSDFGYTLVPHSMFDGCVVNDRLLRE